METCILSDPSLIDWDSIKCLDYNTSCTGLAFSSQWGRHAAYIQRFLYQPLRISPRLLKIHWQKSLGNQSGIYHCLKHCQKENQWQWSLEHPTPVRPGLRPNDLRWAVPFLQRVSEQRSMAPPLILLQLPLQEWNQKTPFAMHWMSIWATSIQSRSETLYQGIHKCMNAA